MATNRTLRSCLLMEWSWFVTWLTRWRQCYRTRLKLSRYVCIYDLMGDVTLEMYRSGVGIHSCGSHIRDHFVWIWYQRKVVKSTPKRVDQPQQFQRQREWSLMTPKKADFNSSTLREHNSIHYIIYLFRIMCFNNNFITNYTTCLNISSGSPLMGWMKEDFSSHYT